MLNPCTEMVQEFLPDMAQTYRDLSGEMGVFSRLYSQRRLYTHLTLKKGGSKEEVHAAPAIRTENFHSLKLPPQSTNAPPQNNNNQNPNESVATGAFSCARSRFALQEGCLLIVVWCLWFETSPISKQPATGSTATTRSGPQCREHLDGTVSWWCAVVESGASDAWERWGRLGRVCVCVGVLCWLLRVCCCACRLRKVLKKAPTAVLVPRGSRVEHFQQLRIVERSLLWDWFCLGSLIVWKQ